MLAVLMFYMAFISSRIEMTPAFVGIRFFGNQNKKQHFGISSLIAQDGYFSGEGTKENISGIIPQ